MLKKLTSQIPNTLTLSNLFLGCIAIERLFLHEWETAAFLVLLAAVVDFFDGFAARALKAHSAIGKDLDSLADCVTFGVVPGFVIYLHLVGLQAPVYLPYVAFLIPMFSALRLAKFNHDTRQSNCFFGLPTPANGLFIMFLPATLSHFTWSQPLSESISFWVLVALIQSFLLVAPVRLQAFKFKNMWLAENWPKYLIVGASLPMLVIFSYFATPFVIIGYILISLISNFYQPNEV
jgi:CDP-diacylglycerol--serine O-phosphatidyltransferase